MSVDVPKGSIVTYVSSDWYSGVFGTAKNVVDAVGQKLIADGLTIRNVDDISVGTFGIGFHFSVKMEVQVTGGTGYAKADDVASIINHEVYQVTGHLPGVWSVPDVTVPETGVPGFLDWLKGIFTGKESTGELGSKSQPSFLDSLTSKSLLYIGLAIFGFVAALALIGYSGALKRTA